jgi:AraC family transcriptional regulator of adaptative response/methylated-DNA-[protein]-cysteine methyltransferase
MIKLTYDEMVRAMRSNDATYDGVFWVGVHSTGIYCLPSCPARAPLLKNVRFYNSRTDAIETGLRGCMRCKSDRYPDVLPEWMQPLISVMKENVSLRMDEDLLCEIAQVDISTVRRSFKRYFGVTPSAYHRKLRLRHSRELIESGVNYLAAAFECGFESSSGFRDAFVREFGKPPGAFHVG